MSLKKLLAATAVAGALASAPAQAFLFNWYLDPDGAGAAPKTLINEVLELGNGPSYVQTSVPNILGQFTFNEWGAVQVTGHDGAPGFDGFLGTGPTGDLSALFTTTGNATFSGAISYTGGQIDVWSNIPGTYATAAGIYGANTGIKIATFTPVSGTGQINAAGLPNGEQSIQGAATFLAPGYFFAPDGTTDLSTLLGGPPIVFGFATVNASRITNPSALFVSEIINGFAGDATFTNCLPGQSILTGPPCTGVTGEGEFVIGNNGQFRLNVPEPGSLALLGLALLGMAGFSRRKPQA